MKTARLGLLLLTFTLAIHAEKYTVNPEHTEIGFSIKHLMVSNVKGAFNTFEGTLDYDGTDKKLISVQGSISTASIDTNNEKRDEHLNTDKYFNTGTYPKMEFRSTSVETLGDDRFEITGNLKVLGANHEVVLPATITGPVEDPRGNWRIGIESAAVLNRRDLGITSSPAAMIGDKIKIRIIAEAVFKPQATPSRQKKARR
jgi:polyisoprenoid-binding protein YceI